MAREVGLVNIVTVLGGVSCRGYALQTSNDNLGGSIKDVLNTTATSARYDLGCFKRR